MPIEIKMPALSPTMEQGKLAKWLVSEGDSVESGDILAEIETDKATMEFEAVDEGTIASIAVAEGTDEVSVGTVIAVLSVDGEDTDTIAAPASTPPSGKPDTPAMAETAQAAPPSPAQPSPPSPPPSTPAAPATLTTPARHDRIIASPLARRIAQDKGIDLAGLKGSGPNGRIVKADVEAAMAGGSASTTPGIPVAKPATVEMKDETRALLDDRIPHSVTSLSSMRKTIARRLTQSMQEAPHIYLTVDVTLDRLLAMRKEMNAALESRGIKLSVNDMLIKALGRALIDVPECNVAFAGSELITYSRADISVAVSIPGGLITPIIADANGKSLSEIAVAAKDLAARAKQGKLQPDEYQGGTASISNMGMMGIKQFTAVINPPQATILAIGAGEKRPWVMDNGELGVATVMSVTGSFDHRAIDGADGARLMTAFKRYVESPLGMVA